MFYNNNKLISTTLMPNIIISYLFILQRYPLLYFYNASIYYSNFPSSYLFTHCPETTGRYAKNNITLSLWFQKIILLLTVTNSKCSNLQLLHLFNHTSSIYFSIWNTSKHNTQLPLLPSMWNSFVFPQWVRTETLLSSFGQSEQTQ